MRAYIGDAAGNATKAAELAGYSQKNARPQASRLLAKANIRAELDKVQGKLADKAQITAARVIQEYLTFSLSDVRELFTDQGQLRPINELSEHVARAIASVEVTKQRTYKAGETTTEEWVSKVRLWDKPRGLEALAKTLGLFKEQHEHTGPDGGPIAHRVTFGGRYRPADASPR